MYQPISISFQTVTALIEQRDGLLPHQKSQLDNSRTVTELFRKKKIKLTETVNPAEALEKFKFDTKTFYREQRSHSKGKKASRLKKKRVVYIEPEKFNIQLGDRLNEIIQAIAADGLTVGLLPLMCYGTTDHSVLKIPDSYANSIVDCRLILECLKAHRRISDDKYKFAIKSLGQNSNPQALLSPLLHTKLFLMSGVADILAKAQILSTVCDNFEVFVSKPALDEAERTVHYYEELADLGGSIKQIISRINDGIEDDIYKFIHVPDNKRKQNADEKIGQDMSAALDLFLYDPQPGDVICIDDRALTRYAVRQENKTVAPIIGITELLQALRFNAKIDDEEYYAHLLELRRGNLRYLPISEDEIIYHLNFAQYENGQIVETEALATLRQYRASCLLDKSSLQITGNSYSEAPYIYQGTEEIENAIASVWNDSKGDYKLATAQADWILESLYTGQIGCAHLRDDQLIKISRRSDVQGLASDVSNLIMRGIVLTDNILAKEQTERLKYYFDWINSRILRTRYISSPEILKAIGENVEKRINFVFNLDYENEDRKQLAGLTIGRFFLQLPKMLSRRINLNKIVLDWMKVRVSDVITINNINFAATDYWQAVEKVVNGQEASIKAYETSTDYFLTLHPAAEEVESSPLFPLIRLMDAERREVSQMRDNLFGVLQVEPADRLHALNEQRELFDYRQPDFENEARVITGIKDPTERVRRFYNEIENSTEFFYSQIEDRIRRRDDITWPELMPPAAENLAGYFRLPVDGADRDFTALLSESAELLLAEKSLKDAIALLSALPVRMPETVVQRFINLAEEEKEKLLAGLSSAQASPIQLMHLINLTLQAMDDENSSLKSTAEALLNRLYQPAPEENSEFKAFRTILLFVTNEFYFWQESSKLSPQIALALIWGHATRLYNICRRVGMEIENIVNGFSRLRENYFYESLVRNPEIGFDCTYPYRISGTLLLTHAASNLFAGINPAILSSLEIPERIRSRIFRDREDDQPPMPAIKLLTDSVLCDDKLQSLFGGDRYDSLSSIVGGADIEVLKSETLRQSAETYLKGLAENPKDTKNWVWIYAIAGDLPLYQKLRKLCLQALKAFKLEHLNQPETENPEFILFAVANQVANTNDQRLRENFRDMIIELFKQRAAERDSEENSQRLLTIMSAVLALSYIPGYPTKSNEELSGIIDRLSDECPDFYDRFGHVFLNSFWHTKQTDSKEWRLLDLKYKSLY